MKLETEPDFFYLFVGSIILYLSLSSSMIFDYSIITFWDCYLGEKKHYYICNLIF